MAITIELVSILFFLFIIDFYLIVSKKNLFVIIIMVGILTLFPQEAIGIISGHSYCDGGKLNISLAGYNSIICMGIYLIINNFKFKHIDKKRFILIMLGSLGMFIIRLANDGSEAISNKILDSYLLPISMAILMIELLDYSDMKKVINVLFYFILFNACISCIEYFYGESLFFHNYYLRNIPWYINIYNSSQYVSFRTTALLGHPLTCAIYYIVGIIYCLNAIKITKKNNKIITVVEIFILIFAIYTTNARVAIVVLLAYIIYYLITRKEYSYLILLIIGIMFSIIFVDFKELYYTIFARDTTNSSILVRINTLTRIYTIPLKNLIFGVGYNNFNVFEELGMAGSLEISYLIILLENGIIGFVLWLINLLLIFNINNLKSYEFYLKKLLIEILVSVLLIFATSNSLGDNNTLNYLLYFFLASTSIRRFSEKSR